MCDTPLTVDRAAALACYLQALCSYLLDRTEPAPAESDYLVYNYNRFQACRFGLEGTLVHPKGYDATLLREDIITTLGKVRRHAQALSGTAALDHLELAARTGSDATILRKRYRESGSAHGMVGAAMEMFRS